MAPEDDKKVKDLLEGGVEDVVDEQTRKELERWFGLPSFEELEAKGEPAKPEDPEIAAVLERRAKALESVDLALVESVGTRYDGKGEKLIHFWPKLEVHVDPDVALFDHAMLAKVSVVADPREIERPEDLDDDLKDCTPQAILRDLHRPEEDFRFELEIIDMAAEQKLDIVAEVQKAMRTSWKLPRLGRSPVLDCRDLIAELRHERAQKWADIPARMKLSHRKVDG